MSFKCWLECWWLFNLHLGKLYCVYFFKKYTNCEILAWKLEKYNKADSQLQYWWANFVVKDWVLLVVNAVSVSRSSLCFVFFKSTSRNHLHLKWVTRSDVLKFLLVLPPFEIRRTLMCLIFFWEGEILPHGQSFLSLVALCHAKVVFSQWRLLQINGG